MNNPIKVAGGAITITPRTWYVDLLEVYCPVCRVGADPAGIAPIFAAQQGPREIVEPIFHKEIDKTSFSLCKGDYPPTVTALTCPDCGRVHVLRLELELVAMLSPVTVWDANAPRRDRLIEMGDQYAALYTTAIDVDKVVCPIHGDEADSAELHGPVLYCACPKCEDGSMEDGTTEYLIGSRIIAELFSFRRN